MRGNAKIPHVDPTVRHVGVSKLRGLNASRLRAMTDTLVIQENDRPLAVLLTYEKFLMMQEVMAISLEMTGEVSDLDALRATLTELKSGRLQSLEEIDAVLRELDATLRRTTQQTG